MKRTIIKSSLVFLFLTVFLGCYFYFQANLNKNYVNDDTKLIIDNLIKVVGGLPDDHQVVIGESIVIICQTTPRKMVEWGMHTPILDKIRNYKHSELSVEDIDQMVEELSFSLKSNSKSTILYSDYIKVIDKGLYHLTVEIYSNNNKFFIELTYKKNTQPSHRINF